MDGIRTVIPMSDESKRISAEDISSQIQPAAFLASPVARDAMEFSLPRYEDLPALELYRDQVISFIEEVFAPLSAWSDGPWLTPAMVNNYVKAGVVPPPVKKRYGREHVAKLLAVCVMKQLLPIAAIQRLMRAQSITYPVDVSYCYLATEVNNALIAAFNPGEPSPEDTATTITRETMLVHSVAGAFAARAYLMSYLSYAGYEG